MKLRLKWKLFFTYISLAILSVLIVSFFLYDAVTNFHIEQTKRELKSTAVLLEELSSGNSIKTEFSPDKMFKHVGPKTGKRMTLISSDGKVLADSEKDITIMENHKNRPEIIESKKKGIGISIRYSNTLKKNMLYVAIPFVGNSGKESTIRTSIPLLTLTETMKPVFTKFMIASLFAILIAAFFSLIISWVISRPIGNIQRVVEDFADGNFDTKLETSNTYEFAKLSENMNMMAVELNNRIDTITMQRNELAKLENIRKEFVANVSHELRTPITSIKGYIETLKDGALEDKENAIKFLEIISRQTDRLNSIIEDLLCLSRIEKENESNGVDIEVVPVDAVLQVAVSICSASAQKKDVEIKIECDSKLKAQMNARLIEQAVVNLLDNSIKYSESEEAIVVNAQIEKGNIVIKVRDFGKGIATEHHERIFERFYRIDKARSRNLGGTGLGLAIVKHIAQSHGGTATLESELGKGTTFSIIIPA